MPNFHSRDGVTSRLRKRGHDYGGPGSYFLTLCAQHRVCLFGDVRDGEMQHSLAGVVVESWWHSIAPRFASVIVDTMVVMPNHLHGILHVGADPDIESIPELGDVMHWFKVRTTYDYTIGVKTDGWPRFPGKLWQPRYYERIIRNDRELDAFQTYILDNPAMWEKDEYHRETEG